MSKLREIREEKGLLQEDMAKLLGISLCNYSKKESGIIKVSIIEAKLIADFFGKTIEEIFFAKDVSKSETIED